MPIAHFADHIVRSPEGVLEKTDSYPKIHLKELNWDPKMANKSLVPFDHYSLSDLAFSLTRPSSNNPYNIPKIKTAFYFKLIISFLPLSFTFAVIPFCLSYERHKRVFLIYAITLFSFFALYMLLDSLATLSEHRVLSPLLALVVPFFFLTGLSLWRFFRKTV